MAIGVPIPRIPATQLHLVTGAASVIFLDIEPFKHLRISIRGACSVSAVSVSVAVPAALFLCFFCVVCVASRPSVWLVVACVALSVARLASACPWRGGGLPVSKLTVRLESLSFPGCFAVSVP